MKEQLLTKIEGHSAVIAVIGLGYVGLPLAVAFAERGFPVVGDRRGCDEGGRAESRRIVRAGYPVGTVGRYQVEG